MIRMYDLCMHLCIFVQACTRVSAIITMHLSECMCLYTDICTYFSLSMRMAYMFVKHASLQHINAGKHARYVGGFVISG
jgi:hypothetical protein